MRRRAGILIAMLLADAPLAAAAPIDVAAWARSTPTSYHLSGDKNEPTYLAAIDIERRGDVFTITGGAPAWAERSIEAIEVLPDGTLRHRICPRAMRCDDGWVPSGFLAAAALLSALREGRSLGEAETVAYGERQVICIPAERIGIAEPILDPCFDRLTGAVLAQRHRLSGKFDGPSLDPWSIRVQQAAAKP
ncbi:exported hypothetical protein [Mesorhizobium plurifarium]|uniref:Uncharacterized protein n=1 Tax=Mesorhizobium plurifarium TaxID=69974 RepID=A0A0K2VQF6_MESPL|nr:exported hypothetical protein [Mesorhizobium plurifarium]